MCCVVLWPPQLCLNPACLNPHVLCCVVAPPALPEPRLPEPARAVLCCGLPSPADDPAYALTEGWSEALPLVNAVHMGHGCYLKALLAANVPAKLYGLPVSHGMGSMSHCMSHGGQHSLYGLPVSRGMGSMSHGGR